MKETETQHVTDDGLPESTLRDVLSSESLISLEQAFRLGLDIIDDLVRLQNRGIFCHELRPEDIVLTGKAEKPHIAVTTIREESGLQLSESGRGLSSYVSPEVARGDPPDALSNVWILGVLLFEMLTGRLPFLSIQSVSSDEAGSEDTVPDLLEYRNDVPDALAVMIYQMLDTDRDLRLSSVELARTELECYLGNLLPSPPNVSEEDEDFLNIASTPTRFVGREEELSRIAQLFAEGQCRLLTLIGPGGVGKSRLAFHAAERLAEYFNDGVYFVPLTPVRSAAFIALAIGNSLRLGFSGQREPVHQLIDYLRARQLLLVLDNFDHLLQGAELVAQLLSKTDELGIIVTSRERLNLHQERLLEVRGLPVPAHVQVDAAENYSSVQLFVDNAERIHSNFSLSDVEKPHVIRLCQLLGGLPLGIVLASGWVRVLTCEEIAHEIERGIDFLATAEQDVPEQHRSVRAAFDRSWMRLTEHERVVLTRLSVFHGGFGRVSAEKIGGASLRTLLALVDKSLLQRDTFGRYQIHELLRQYLEERLDDTADELERIRELHASFYAAVMNDRKDQLKGERQKDALEEIERDLGNVQKGWEWAVDHVMVGEIDKYLDPLHSLHQARGWFREAGEIFGRASTMIREVIASNGYINSESQRVLGRLLARQGVSHYHLADYGKARTLINEGLDFLRPANALEDITFALSGLAHVARCEGKYDEARQLCEECLATSRETADRLTEARALDGLGTIAMQLGKYDEAKTLHEEALATSRGISDLQGIAGCLNSLGNIAHITGDPHEARKRYEEGLLILRELGDRAGVCGKLHNLGMVAVTLGEYKRAKELLAESLEIARDIGDEYLVAHGLHTLGEACFEFGEYEKAKEALEESLAVCRRIGNRRAAAYCLTTLGSVLHSLGDYEGAERAHGASLTIVRELGLRRPEAASLLGLGEVAAATGDVERSTSLRGQAFQIAVEIKAVPLALAILLRWADAFERQGDTARAAELYAFISDHESSKQSVVDRCSEMLSDLASRLSAEELEEAVARGKAHALEEIVKELLEEE